MAVIRDNMPAFRALPAHQPGRGAGAARCSMGRTAWVLAGGLDTWDWLKDRVKRPSVRGGPGRDRRAVRDPVGGWRAGDRGDGHAAGRGPARRRARAVRAAGGGGGAGGVAADPEPGDAGGKPEPGHAVLVLPGRVELLPGGGQHLLRGHADGDEPGALHPGGEPVCGGEPVGYGAGVGGAGCVDGDPEPAAGSGWCRRRSFSWAPRWTSSG